ncbi:hypothetical protein ACWEFL_06120 [Streptomyces sp. NPDC004838]
MPDEDIYRLALAVLTLLALLLAAGLAVTARRGRRLAADLEALRRSAGEPALQARERAGALEADYRSRLAAGEQELARLRAAEAQARTELGVGALETARHRQEAETARAEADAHGRNAERFRADAEAARAGEETARTDAETARAEAEALADALARLRAESEGDRVRLVPELPTAGPGAETDTGSGQVPADLDPVPDTEADGGDQGALRIRAASVRGLRHRRAAVPRRDAFVLRSYDGRFNRPFTLAALAAGNPVGNWAQIAARRTCLSLADQLAGQAGTLEQVLSGGDHGVLRELLHSVVTGTADSLTRLAQSRNAASTASVATDFVAVLSPMGDTEERDHLVFGVGPCGALRLRNGRWERLPLPGTHANPAPSPFDRGGRTLWYGTASTVPDDVLVLCSPATLDLLQNTHVQDFLGDQWSAGAPHLPEFLWQFGVRTRGAAGDRTAVCLWDSGSVSRIGSAAPPAAEEG